MCVHAELCGETKSRGAEGWLCLGCSPRHSALGPTTRCPSRRRPCVGAARGFVSQPAPRLTCWLGFPATARGKRTRPAPWRQRGGPRGAGGARTGRALGREALRVRDAGRTRGHAEEGSVSLSLRGEARTPRDIRQLIREMGSWLRASGRFRLILESHTPAFTQTCKYHSVLGYPVLSMGGTGASGK